jgi:hypothetical protein
MLAVNTRSKIVLCAVSRHEVCVSVCACVIACVRAFVYGCVRVCLCACVRACVGACVRTCVRGFVIMSSRACHIQDASDKCLVSFSKTRYHPFVCMYVCMYVCDYIH